MNSEPILKGPHLIVGRSGSGKTTQCKKLLSSYIAKHPEAHIEVVSYNNDEYCQFTENIHKAYTEELGQRLMTMGSQQRPIIFVIDAVYNLKSPTLHNIL